MILNRTVAPATLISTADAKAHLRVDGSDDDSLIGSLVNAASAYLDGPAGAVGKALLTQTWEAKREPISGRAEFVFPVAPLISVSAISYFDRDNVEQTLATSAVTIYQTEDRAWMVPDIGTNWPAMYQRPDAMTVTATYGFGAASAVPANIVAAAHLLVAHLYENRLAVGQKLEEMPLGVAALIGVSRIGWVGA